MAVAGGGVAGLSSAYHLTELWRARWAGEPGAPRLVLHLVAPLVPDPDSDGSGLGGKAMSRSFTGYFDQKHGMPREPFYGPMMPYKGCIPHGYHILWEYPNLRRMLGNDGRSPDFPVDGRRDAPRVPLLRPPAGAPWVGAFQALLDDPSPGGPGVALVGLADPSLGEEGARTPAAKALFRLRARGWTATPLKLFERIFGGLIRDVDPLVFADLFFAPELDVEMRLALIGASLVALRTNPEVDTIEVDGVRRHLYDVEYATWAEAMVRDWTRSLERGFVLETPVGELVFGSLLDEVQQIQALYTLGSGVIGRHRGVGETERHEGLRGALDDLALVWSEADRVLTALPRAVSRIASGTYPAWRSVHFRFAPDATFASPFSFDAAQLVRSLAFCYRTPSSARMWTVDGQKVQTLFLLFWRRLEALAATSAGLVTLDVHAGRVDGMGEGAPGEGAWIAFGGVHGHGGAALERAMGRHGSPAADLGLPHTPSIDPHEPPPASPRRMTGLDGVVGAMPPAILRDVIASDEARHQLDRVSRPGNETLELLLYTREPIAYGPVARAALSHGAIGGLEGAFCMLADYRCGLWSDDVLAAEDPFGDGQPFAGSIIEAAGGYADVFACLTRDDAYGWPREIKAKLRSLLSDPDMFEAVDERPWPLDDSNWRTRRADGTWRPERAASQAGYDDWVVAARWLVWGYVRQLSQIQSLGPRAVRQFAALADRLDPRDVPVERILDPAKDPLRDEVRYVVMRNAKVRNRFYSPAVGDWPHRPISGLPLDGTTRLFPAGDWTRNGLDIVCMEAACLSGMRAARGVFERVLGEPPPTDTAAPIAVLPPASWYDGTDPLRRRPR